MGCLIIDDCRWPVIWELAMNELSCGINECLVDGFA